MASTDDDGFAIVIISLTLFSLIMMYATLSVNAIKSFQKIVRNSNAIALGKTFYSLILVLCLVRVFAWVALVVELWVKQDLVEQDIQYSDFFNKLLLTIRYIPETLFLITFMILLWNVLVLYHVCHLRVDQRLRDVSLPPLKTLGKSVLTIIITLLFSAQATITLVYWFLESWGPDNYIYANAYMCISTPSTLIAAELYLHCKFSGVPYKSPQARRRLIRVNFIFVFWGICQGITGGLEFFEHKKEQQIYQAILGTNKDGTLLSQLIGPIVFVTQLFLLEVLPLVFATDSKTTENFSIKKEMQDLAGSLHQGPNNPLLDNSIDNGIIVSTSNAEKTNHDISRFTTSEPHRQMSLKWINSNLDVVLQPRPFAENKEGKLGQLYYCSGNENLFARVVKFDKITTYVAEQMNKEISKLSKIESRFLLRISGYYHDDNSVTIFYERVQNQSLASLLHEKKSSKAQLAEKLKESIVSQIAAAVQALHSQNPPIAHGHLTSSNVLLDKEYTVKVTDYGLTSLKKYASVKTGYSIMDASVAPEYLSDHPKYVSTADISADIYSFGFLLWEIFTEEKPFGNVGPKELYNLVVNGKSRPKIPNSFVEILANLIRACWQSDPKNRPNIDRVIDTLNEIDGRFSDDTQQ